MPLEVLNPAEEQALRATLTQLGRSAFAITATKDGEHWTLDNRWKAAKLFALSLMLDAGLRVSEAAGVLFTDFMPAQLGNATITVRAENAKTARSRTIPLPVTLGLQLLNARNNWARTALDNRDRPIVGVDHIPAAPSARTIRRWCYELTNVAIGRPVAPHALRHTAATRWMKHTDIRTVQELLGHRSLSSTQIYTHPNTDDLAAAVNSRANPSTAPWDKELAEELTAAAKSQRAARHATM